MAETTVNIPLLRKCVEWAEAEAAKPPELCEWYQAMWVTTFDATEKDRWGVVAQHVTREQVDKAAECGTCYCIAGYVVATVDGPRPGEISAHAADLLGIEQHAAAALFHADNTIADVRRIAEEIAGERL